MTTASPRQASRADSRPSVLRVEDLRKSYGATKALKGISFNVRPGEIHALLGGNGSGKSTAIKALAGVIGADGGRVTIGSNDLEARDINPAVARTSGLRFVHQQAAIFPNLSIAENIALGSRFPGGRGGPISWRAVRAEARELVGRFNLDMDVTRAAASLRPASQAMVSIVRALKDVDELTRAVLVLDEPTAALPSDEANLLLVSLRGYADHGLGVIFVTHRLDEVLGVADRATVLRDGLVSAALETEDLNRDRLVQGIAGATVGRLEQVKSRPSSGGRRLVSVKGLSGRRLRSVSFEIRQGEILGIAGLLGSGRSSLLRSLFGLEACTGEVTIGTERAAFKTPREAIRAGVAYVPEDRANEAAFRDMSVTENISIVSTNDFWERGWLHIGAERKEARSLLGRFGIKAPNERAAIGALSGGNQQKVVLVRWIRSQLKLLLLDEPTQGVDVGARAEIFQAVREAADRGTAVLMVSSDFEELALIASRILVMHQGAIVEEITDPATNALDLERAVHRIEETAEVT